MANMIDCLPPTARAVLHRLSIALLTTAFAACAATPEATAPAAAAPAAVAPAAAVTPPANPAAELVPVRPAIYAPFRLTADLSSLSPEERRMLGLFIDAAQIMDGLFWKQAYGDRDQLLNGIEDLRTRQFAIINYGPWDRLEDNRPFVPGVGAKPEGAAFYPPDMSREEFERAQLPGKDNLYTFITRDPNGALALLPYGFRFAAELRQAATLLTQAAALAPQPGLRNYLELRADALTSDDYRASDMAWLDMKDNRIDLVIGPIETYEDRLFGYKAAYEAYVLVKDMAWSKRLARYAAMLPDLQRGLPVPDCVQGGGRGQRLGSQRLRRDLLRRRLQRRIQDHRDQPAERRAGAARQGDAAPAAQERHASQVREDPGADRSGADRGGPAEVTSPSTRSSPTRCSTRWRTGSVSRTPSTARARFARRSRIAPAHSRKARRTCWVST